MSNNFNKSGVNSPAKPLVNSVVKAANAISAVCIVSESEIQHIDPGFRFSNIESDQERLKGILFSLGMDTSKNFIKQPNIQHRNRLNKVVTCDRYVGNERLDRVWIDSGYASREAKDKASGSRMLEDIYRARDLTEDRQLKLEDRDRYYSHETVDENGDPLAVEIKQANEAKAKKAKKRR